MAGPESVLAFVLFVCGCVCGCGRMLTCFSSHVERVSISGSGSRFDRLQQFGQGEHRGGDLPDAHNATQTVGNRRLPRRGHATKHNKPVCLFVSSSSSSSFRNMCCRHSSSRWPKSGRSRGSAITAPCRRACVITVFII